ncbi:MAG: hypothetical protein ACW98D_20765 [Promethearchaeota archaeon]
MLSLSKYVRLIAFHSPFDFAQDERKAIYICYTWIILKNIQKKWGDIQAIRPPSNYLFLPDPI